MWGQFHKRYFSHQSLNLAEIRCIFYHFPISTWHQRYSKCYSSWWKTKNIGWHNLAYSKVADVLVTQEAMVISSHDTDFVLFRFQHHKGYSVSLITGTHWSWIQFPFPFLDWFQPVCMSSNYILIKRPKISHWARLRYILIFEANHCFRTPPESELTYALNFI